MQIQPNRHRRWWPLAALLAAACADGNTTADTPAIESGSFVIDVDPDAGTAEITVFGATSSGVYLPVRQGSDGNPNTNPPGTFQAITTNVRAGGAGGCAADRNCFTITLTNFTGATQLGVFMGVDRIVPVTGRSLASPDPVPMGVTAPLGGRDFGDLPDGGSAARQFDLDVPDGGPYRVFGRFWGDDGRGAGVFDTATFGQGIFG